ncbi:hypothetical protein LOAG_01634 [Loa loa]|uniref:Uncharacterized protein n=1 Tax=Loa loa TaxID=7209 RepID=A0A1S0U8W6_LOALO|nr:hypothetical protein LOAG_01634 [Loa loa]EFO26852.1 hypothetical protein LOAG_01634 [Loa loa]
MARWMKCATRNGRHRILERPRNDLGAPPQSRLSKRSGIGHRGRMGEWRLDPPSLFSINTTISIHIYVRWIGKLDQRLQWREDQDEDKQGVNERNNVELKLPYWILCEDPS